MLTILWIIAASILGLFIGGLIMALAFAAHNSDADGELLATLKERDATIVQLRHDLNAAEDGYELYRNLYAEDVRRRTFMPTKVAP